MESAFRLKNIAVYSVFAIFFVLDRALKYLALKTDSSFNLIADYVKFNYTPNFNIAFSLPVKGPGLVILLIILVILLISYYIFLHHKRYPHYITMPLLMIILGSVSNLIDRLTYGFIIDYLDVYNFTILNLADIFISLGAIWLLLASFKAKRS